MAAAKTKIKMCGMRTRDDILAVNGILPDLIGFIFVPGRKRYITPEKALELRRLLDLRIKAVGVFIDEAPENAAALFREGAIDMVQLHGSEDDGYIARLRGLADVPVIKAFRVRPEGAGETIKAAESSAADFVLLDSGAGSGDLLDWRLIENIKRPYFLAGGLSPENVAAAVRMLRPFAVDVSSGIETDGSKDITKMEAFAEAVRKEDRI